MSADIIEDYLGKMAKLAKSHKRWKEMDEFYNHCIGNPLVISSATPTQIARIKEIHYKPENHSEDDLWTEVEKLFEAYDRQIDSKVDELHASITASLQKLATVDDPAKLEKLQSILQPLCVQLDTMLTPRPWSSLVAAPASAPASASASVPASVPPASAPARLLTIREMDSSEMREKFGNSRRVDLKRGLEETMYKFASFNHEKIEAVLSGCYGCSYDAVGEEAVSRLNTLKNKTKLCEPLKPNPRLIALTGINFMSTDPYVAPRVVCFNSYELFKIIQSRNYVELHKLCKRVLDSDLNNACNLAMFYVLWQYINGCNIILATEEVQYLIAENVDKGLAEKFNKAAKEQDLTADYETNTIVLYYAQGRICIVADSESNEHYAVNNIAVVDSAKGVENSIALHCIKKHKNVVNKDSEKEFDRTSLAYYVSLDEDGFIPQNWGVVCLAMTYATVYINNSTFGVLKL